jgi:hypothetical protein
MKKITSLFFALFFILFVYTADVLGEKTTNWWINEISSDGSAFAPISTLTHAPASASVVITSPENNASFDAAIGFTVIVNASHPSGFNWMRLWIDSENIEADVYEIKHNSPWEFNVSGLSAGTYTFHVRARDNDGGTTDSEKIIIKITDNQDDGGEITVPISSSANPFIRHMFTADPSARVWADGRLYVYPSTDVNPPVGCDRMDGYHVFSTDDMVNWVDHGQILHSSDIPWGREEGGFMWAPDCMYRGGTYYYYFPHPSDTDWAASWKIGIATSSSPTGPFTQQGYLENAGGRRMIDPNIFIDDNDQAYLVYGGAGTLHLVKLKDNMMEVDGDYFDLTPQFPKFKEGAWMFKRENYYYIIYPDRGNAFDNMRYSMATNIYGPWQEKGILLDAGSSQTMHGSVVEYLGQWWLFYHNGDLSGIGNLRSICFDPITFNPDGTMQKVISTSRPLWKEHWPQVFTAADHKGTAARVMTYGGPDYDLAKLQSMGIANNSISSIKVPGGYVVDLFEGQNFTGPSITIYSNIANLESINWNNRASSLRVRMHDQSMKFEAELGTLTWPARVGNKANASGGKAIAHFNEGAAVRIDNINSLKGGTYKLNIRYATPNGTSIHVDVNGVDYGWLVCRGSGSYQDFYGNSGIYVDLQQGNNVLTISSGGQSIDIDYVFFTPTDVSVAVTSFDAAKSFNASIYPNPVDENFVFVEFGLETLSKVSLRILDMNGSLIAQPLSNQAFEPGAQKIEIPLIDIAPGIYIMQISIDDIRQIHKIIVM